MTAGKRNSQESGIATSSQPKSAGWLAENGPKELELLFRAIIYNPSAPILIADDDRKSRDASSGAGRFLGLPREKIIGRQIDEFAAPGTKPQVSQLWRAFLKSGEQEGVLRLVGADGTPREVEYTARKNILPVRHALALHDKDTAAETEGYSSGRIPSWVQDYALYLLDSGGHVAAWYAGAARIYRYPVDEAIDQHVSRFYPGDDTVRVKLAEELKRASTEGHAGAEGWQTRKDGSRFWANAITMALRDGSGKLQGFARAVRDFTGRHERDEKLRRSRARLRPAPCDDHSGDRLRRV